MHLGELEWASASVDGRLPQMPTLFVPVMQWALALVDAVTVYSTAWHGHL